MAYRFAGEASSLAGECPLEEIVHEGRVQGGLTTTTTAATRTAATAAVRRA